jgi:hypothetical protein
VLLVRIALLAVGSMFWPLLLVVVVIALESNRPERILVWFYVGGYLTATSVGAILVFVLQDSPLMTGSRLGSAPWLDVAFGTAAVALGVILRRSHLRRTVKRARGDTTKRPSRSKDWLQGLVENGGPLAFAGGVVGSVVPGPLVILGMADIAQLGYGAIATLLVILTFFAIVFAFIEIPIGGFAFAPERTRELTVAAKSWLDRNMLWLASWALLVIGAVQVVRGLIAGPLHS